MKTCFTCKNTLNFNYFHKNKQKKDGFDTNCKSCRKVNSKKHYEKNKETIKIKTNSRYHKIKHTEKYKIQRNSKQKEKLKTDKFYCLTRRLRNRLYYGIKNTNWKKNSKFIEYIGCNRETLIQHIESQFLDGMSWENIGKWQLDHHFPLSKARTENDIYTLSHYTNLRPMWANENKSKNNKVEICWQKVIRKKTLVEDIAAGFPIDLNCSDFILARESLSQEHIQFIERYEWLGCIGVGVTDIFTARWNGHLAGIVMMSLPNLPQFGEMETLIQRGACSAWSPKNLGSKLIMFGCKWMVQNTNKRIFTAYSDPEAGEIGTIYQACNFDYLGKNFGAKTLFKLDSGKEVNRRYFTRKHYLKQAAKNFGLEYNPDWTWKTIPTNFKNYIKSEMKRTKSRVPDKKGKYALLLTKGKERLQKPWTKEPYPKRSQ